MTPTDTVLERLRNAGCNPRQSRPGQWTARCPNTTGHRNGDRHPSLSVAEGREGAVLHCAGGCDPREVTAALDLALTDLFPPRTEPTAERRIDRIHDYHDADGTLVMQAIRYHPKAFSQRQPDGYGGWVYNLRGIDRRPLYRLPQLLDGIRRGDDIWIAEGEKDVDALTRLGCVATCNPMGAGKWRPEHTEWMTGAGTVHIIADDDPAGRAHATDIAHQLAGHVNELRVRLPADHCKDVSDHLAQGHTLDQLGYLAWDTNEPAATTTSDPHGWELIDLAAHLNGTYQRPAPTLLRRRL